MENLFITYITSGRIRTPDDLRSVYRKIVMKTHPDAVGTDKLVAKFIRLTALYEEAKLYLARHEIMPEHEPEKNYRLAFFKHLRALESLDMPYVFNRKKHATEIEAERTEAISCFGHWNTEKADLYVAAQEEYDKVKGEMPTGPYRKNALYLNLHPVFHNIISFHLSGMQFYRMQVRQNLDAVMKRLDERQFSSLKEFLKFLIDDMEAGPALLSG
jgi:hypothetical protein